MADRLTVEELVLIAEKVMGWTAKKEYDSFGYPECWVLHGIAWSSWNPQDSDADAMAVLRAMWNEGQRGVAIDLARGGPAYVHTEGRLHAKAFEIRDAICAAALAVAEALAHAAEKGIKP